MFLVQRGLFVVPTVPQTALLYYFLFYFWHIYILEPKRYMYDVNAQISTFFTLIYLCLFSFERVPCQIFYLKREEETCTSTCF